jgi:hypothetical protein
MPEPTAVAEQDTDRVTDPRTEQGAVPRPWTRPDFEAFDAAPEVTAYFAQD